MAKSPIITRKANSEWAPIIQAQADAARQAETEEQRIRDLSKQVYKEELEKQLAYQRLQKQDTTTSRQKEQEIMRQREQAIKDFDRREREEKGYIQKTLAQQYEAEQQIKSMRSEAERRDWLMAEQQRLKRLNEAMQYETQRQRQQRESLVKLEQGEIAQKEQIKQQRYFEREQEKVDEQQRILEEQQRQYMREKERRDFFQDIRSKQDTNSKTYQTVAQANMKRNSEKAFLEQHWEESVQKRQEMKLQQEYMQKLAAQQATNDFLGKQVQIRQSQQQKEMAEYERERQEMLERAEKVRIISEYQKKVDAEEKERHKNALISQITEQSDRRLEDLKMSEKERRLHLGAIQKSEAAFTSVPGVHPREIPIQRVINQFIKSNSVQSSLDILGNSHSYLPKSVEASAKDFYGGQDPELNKSPTPQARKNVSLEYSYDPRRHDPIINPIGSVIPRPLLGQDTRRGRGLSTLGAAGSATLNR